MIRSSSRSRPQNGFGDLPHISPDDDQITSKLAPLHLYQLSIPAPQPPPGSFDAAAAARGDELFSGKAKCNNCHVEPLWTDPGWNMHSPAEICIDSFQADRGPDHRYRTSPIGELFTHFKGGFYHDGRFPILASVVDHYNTCLGLGLASNEKNDLVQYLLSLTFGPQRESKDTQGKSPSQND
jgi:cytochrome c peroxidase